MVCELDTVSSDDEEDACLLKSGQKNEAKLASAVCGAIAMAKKTNRPAINRSEKERFMIFFLEEVLSEKELLNCFLEISLCIIV